MLRFFEKKAFVGCKNQVSVIGDKNAGLGVRVAEAGRRSIRHEDDFDCLGGHSANQEALEVSLRGSRLRCTPFLRGGT